MLSVITRNCTETYTGGYWYHFQSRQCWFVIHWCKRHCPPPYSRTCSAQSLEPMYLLSAFSVGLKKEDHPFMTKQRKAGETFFYNNQHTHMRTQFNRMLKPLAVPLQTVYIMSKHEMGSTRTIAIWTPFTTALSECERPHPCLKTCILEISCYHSS